MVSLTCDVDYRDGVTLVTARLEGSGVPQRVRLLNRLDGPVWPPRRRGIPEAGWSEDRFETVVPADGAVAVGYASPARPADPPLAVVTREFVDETAGDESRADPATTADALRDLGDPSPPRDAVPLPADDASRSPEQSDRQAAEPSEPLPTEPPGPAATAQSARRPPTEATPAATGNADGAHADGRNCATPEAVAAWLDDVEERLATAERLAAAETVPEATAAVREAGSLDGAERLVETLRDDADALAAVASRAERLADRTAATDVPLETYERLT